MQQLGILAILLLTSKGAAGVTGSGFVVLAATLSSVGTIPVASIALILGVDRFMSEARALTNLIGNGVATIVVSKMEGALDMEEMRRQLSGAESAQAEEPKRWFRPGRGCQRIRSFSRSARLHHAATATARMAGGPGGSLPSSFQFGCNARAARHGGGRWR